MIFCTHLMHCFPIGITYGPPPLEHAAYGSRDYGANVHFVLSPAITVARTA